VPFTALVLLRSSCQRSSIVTLSSLLYSKKPALYPFRGDMFDPYIQTRCPFGPGSCGVLSFLAFGLRIPLGPSSAAHRLGPQSTQIRALTHMVVPDGSIDQGTVFLPLIIHFPLYFFSLGHHIGIYNIDAVESGQHHVRLSVAPSSNEPLRALGQSGDNW
jgi:hypothetical protein